MRIDKVLRIVSSIEGIVSRGEQFEWSGLTHISKHAGLNRQTTWRYCEELVKKGHLEIVEKKWRGETCKRYYLTKLGRTTFIEKAPKMKGFE